MKVIYIAGPFRALNQWWQEQNIRRAETFALQVWQAGAVALCPHLNTRFFQGTLPDSVWLNGDLDLLKRCDAVLMVSGWENSDGACAEKEFAQVNNIPILFDMVDVFRYIKVQKNIFRVPSKPELRANRKKYSHKAYRD